MTRTVDCTGCGRTAVSFDDAVDLCNHVYCPAFDHFQVPRKPVKPYGAQSRTDSVMEVAVNVAIGLFVSLGAQMLIFPLFGIHTTVITDLGIAAAFTVVSVARQYVIRRLFNGRSVWLTLKENYIDLRS